MRLHALRIQAFGPFADEVAVDFDDLGSDGLFLLHGQTGAGKTTILDAVAFALFGKVPGARDAGGRLRSDHAAPETSTRVELEATIGGRRLRISRSPAYERPKKRGEGVTTSNAKVSLEWLDGSGEHLTRIPDVAERVTELLGMSAEQFFQVVLLPQGEFAKFLRASSDDREALLERLFDTGRFSDVEHWLRDQEKTARTECQGQEAALDRIAGQVVQAAGVTEPPSEPDVTWAQEVHAAAKATAITTGAVLTAARERAQQTRTALDEAVRCAELRRRGAEAHGRLAELDAAADTVAAARAGLAAARRAAAVLPVIAEADRAAADAAAAETHRTRAAARLAELPGAPETTDADSLDAAINAWTEETGRWQPLAERLSARPGLVEQIAELDAQTAAADLRLAELGQSIAAAPQRRDELVEQLAAARLAAGRVPELRGERDRCEQLAAAVAARSALDDDLDAAERRLTDARKVELDARERALNLRERRLAGMAAELAGGLVDGEPCAVCGSAEHPAPASPGDDPVSEADEAAADERQGHAERRRAEVEAALAGLREKAAGLEAIIGDTEPAELPGRLAETAEQLTAAEGLAETVDGLEAAVAQADRSLADWKQEVADLSAAQAGRRERCDGLARRLADLDAEVAEATGGRLSLEERLAELAELCRLAGELRDARAEADRARRHAEGTAQRLAEACAEAEFEDPAAARQAGASAAAIAEWEQLLEQVASVRAAAENTLAEPAVMAALAAAEPDVSGRREQADADAEALAAAEREHAIAERRDAELTDLVAQFWEVVDALEPLRARHAEIAGLAELVAGKGQNERRMRLHAYVLAARLAEVLAAASVRLRQMSAGRYEFVHSDDQEARGRRSGLGIEVRDEYTGATRATTTLSGGETFYASLALALGLADVVSAEAGGRVLDTMFIDEGFGSLDPEALDEVMGVLDELRSGGRVVGVVSHVDELRTRIPAQIHVVRGESGSRIRLRAGVSAAP